MSIVIIPDFKKPSNFKDITIHWMLLNDFLFIADDTKQNNILNKGPKMLNHNQ